MSLSQRCFHFFFSFFYFFFFAFLNVLCHHVCSPKCLFCCFFFHMQNFELWVKLGVTQCSLTFQFCCCFVFSLGPYVFWFFLARGTCCQCLYSQTFDPRFLPDHNMTACASYGMRKGEGQTLSAVVKLFGIKHLMLTQQQFALEGKADRFTFVAATHFCSRSYCNPGSHNHLQCPCLLLFTSGLQRFQPLSNRRRAYRGWTNDAPCLIWQ